MKVKLVSINDIINLILPEKTEGSFWLCNNSNENLVLIEAETDKWVLKSNNDIQIYVNNEYQEFCNLSGNTIYELREVISQQVYTVYVQDGLSKMLTLKFKDSSDDVFYIGNSLNPNKGKGNYISINNPKFDYNQLKFTKSSNQYHFYNMNPANKTYVNNIVKNEKKLANGDIIFIDGYTICFSNNIIFLNGDFNNIKIAAEKFDVVPLQKIDFPLNNLAETPNANIVNKDFFVRPPRFSDIIETKKIVIDSPPQKQKIQSYPMFLTLGPMLIMGVSSCVSGATALINVVSGKSTFSQNMPAILTAGCMLVSMMGFPLMRQVYNKNLKKKNEKLRQEKYSEYIAKIEKELLDEMARQKRILIENNISLKDTNDIILYKGRNLWERRFNHYDFLSCRLGVGFVKPNIEIKYPEEHFEMEKDNLLDNLRKMVKDNEYIYDAPVVISLKENFKAGLIGKENIILNYLEGLLLRFIAFSSYDELKIVFFIKKENESFYHKWINSPYVWSDDKDVRFYGTNVDEMVKISSFLEGEFQNRYNASSEDKTKINSVPYYLIVTDDIKNSMNVGIVKSILKNNNNFGFSVLCLTEKLNDLPSECSKFISVDMGSGGIFENAIFNNKQEFKPDFLDFDISDAINYVSNLELENKKNVFELPTMYSFLEMYNVGKIGQLNITNRWKNNNPITSLACPIGVDEDGNLINLDLHEKYHGPHGLIAGMTGSGKSEFIITYILSMCINYSPEEVQFVLIDYKGGGLTGAFENKELGEKIPHLAGTITNLDASETTRSLSSLQSELKRRQRMFNEARDKFGESTIDIYKYQRMYREGKVTEPIAHLIIISDEFAELKAQLPEFMDELISTARIGRSLGVHLILATQKPSGIVNDQIWSNSKFKVCLKVQDKADSNDMIKQPDAAYLKETGRFFLQVGFNEYFIMGQSAYAGCAYYESDKRRITVDTTVNFVNNIGAHIKDIDSEKSAFKGNFKGEEITNLVTYIKEVGKKLNIKAKQLWMDSLSPLIYIDNLKTKYNFQKQQRVIEPVIGEYDAPLEQRQGLVTLPLSKTGNTLIYGMLGSGKEALISALIYSLTTTYTPEEVNIYVLDFGTETLKSYKKFPHVGMVSSSSDEEEINSFFRMIKQIIAERKKILSNYNGSYKYYNDQEGKLPLITIIINNFESFSELFDKLVDELTIISRDASNYGIVFVLTANALNSVKLRLAQNFSEKIALRMNDAYDYNSLFGRTNITPANFAGRGIIKRENLYEFQSASIINNDNVNDFLKTVCDELNSKYAIKARKVPVLPDTVSFADVKEVYKNLSTIPLGIINQTLSPAILDLKNNRNLLVSSKHMEDAKSFIECFVKEISYLKNTDVYLFDTKKIIERNISGVIVDSDYKKTLDIMNNQIKKLEEIYSANNFDDKVLANEKNIICVVLGLNRLAQVLGDEFKKLFTDMITEANKTEKVYYILLDDNDNFKKIEFESWYKSLTGTSRGLWVGSGFNEQTVFRTNTINRDIDNELTNNYGYLVSPSSATLIKLIQTMTEEL